MAEKIFEVNDVLPATTQLRIIANIPGVSWDSQGGAYTTNEYLRVYAYDDNGDDYDFFVKVNGSYLTLSNYNLSKLVNNEWVSCEYVEYSIMSIIIDTSTWTETQRTIVNRSHPIYWEDLNAPSGFTIAFEENGGTTVSSINDATELPTPLPTTTKSGYKFVAWYYESNFQTRAKAGDTIEANTTLYAKWHNLGSLFTEIADAIRSKDGTSENIRDVDFGERVKQIQVEAVIELTQAQYDALATTDLVWGLPAKVTETCSSVGYNPIGTACSVDGEKMIVSGEDLGMSSGCYELTCHSSGYSDGYDENTYYLIVEDE